jgi:uncharacterized SAM-binding protein YcdF (DUF218 family)
MFKNFKENNRWYNVGLSALLFVLVLFLVSSCAFSSKTCVRYLDDSLNKQYDMVVVPGVPFENGSWSQIMKARVYWSKYLYDIGIAKNVMYSGSAVYSPYYESEIMALYAEAIGIPHEHIFTETMAEHSTENIYYSYQKATLLGFSSAALASDPFQTKMLRKFIRKKIDPSIGLLPIVFDTLKVMESSMIDPVVDSESAYKENFVSLSERESFMERFRGTMGLSIDTAAYSSNENTVFTQ